MKKIMRISVDFIVDCLIAISTGLLWRRILPVRCLKVHGFCMIFIFIGGFLSNWFRFITLF